MNKKIILLEVLAVTLVLFLGVVSAATPEKRVTTVNSYQEEVSSDGTKIVWTDKRSGVLNVYARDLASPAPEIAIDATNTRQITPDISGNIIVWADYRKGIPPHIYYKDQTSTGNAHLISPSTNSQFNPRISGNNVIWSELIAHKYTLKGYNIETNKPITLPTSSFHQRYPNIDGNNVVYLNSATIELYNIINGQKTIIGQGGSPNISGDNIIYYQRIGNKYVVKNYNIISKTTTTVSNLDSNASYPNIYGNYVIWIQTTTAGTPSIMVKNISNATNPIIKVCNNNYYLSRPTISGISKIGYFVTWIGFQNKIKPVLFYRNMETISPNILSTVPKNNQWGVNRFSSIIIKFNKFVNSGVNYGKIAVRNLATNKNIAITKYMKYDTLIIKTAAKVPRTFYQVILPAKSVISVAANNLSTTKTITFRTRA